MYGRKPVCVDRHVSALPASLSHRCQADRPRAIASQFVLDQDGRRTIVAGCQPRGPSTFEAAMEWLSETGDGALEVLGLSTTRALDRCTWRRRGPVFTGTRLCNH